MEFKTIDQLTITDCCNKLSVSREGLKHFLEETNGDFSLLNERILGGQSLSGEKTVIAQKLKTLLCEDRRSFLQCKSLQQFEWYLSTYNDGLWRSEASKSIQDFKDEQEEENRGCGLLIKRIVISAVIVIIGAIIYYMFSLPPSDHIDQDMDAHSVESENYEDYAAAYDSTAADTCAQDVGSVCDEQWPSTVSNTSESDDEDSHPRKHGPTYLNVSKSNITIDSEGGSVDIDVSTDGDWEIGTQPESWGHITRYSSSITLRIDSYSGDYDRTDWFTIEAGSYTKRISITQKSGWIDCSSCGGQGTVKCSKCNDGRRDCPHCNNGYAACNNRNYSLVYDNLGVLGHGKNVPMYYYNAFLGMQCIVGYNLEVCPTCGGTNKIECSYCDGVGEKDCSYCDGSGTIECSRCNGKGKIRRTSY